MSLDPAKCVVCQERPGLPYGGEIVCHQCAEERGRHREAREHAREYFHAQFEEWAKHWWARGLAGLEIAEAFENATADLTDAYRRTSE